MKFTAQNMQTIIYQDYSIIMKILKKTRQRIPTKSITNTHRIWLQGNRNN